MNLPRLVLKNIDKSVVGPDHVASGGVHHAFWLTCGARGVENKQNVFCIHRHRRNCWVAHGFYLLDFVFPPHISAFEHRNWRAGTGTNNDALDGFVTYQGVVNDTFERYVFGTAKGTVAGNDKFCTSVF